jgi:phosphatidylglycerophosphatase A
MKPREAAASFFGLGYLPWCPGTWGSLAGFLLVLVLVPLQAAALAVALFFLGVFAAGRWARESRDADPKAVVIDEVVGMMVSMLFLPKSLLFYALGFAIFRILDIQKPFGIRSLESIGGGWGIMLDDLAAGIVTNILLQSAHLIYLLTRV